MFQVGSPWQQSPDLRHVTVYKISRGVCNSRYSNSAGFNITDKMLCTGLINEGGECFFNLLQFMLVSVIKLDTCKFNIHALIFCNVMI